ncbi:hypothetical protein PENSPDRAFT_694527 [Peniophora sp. CONT]|nr:hypothetical protein PENSPDRAFT_694527 [Peniophora sp. CONT]
MPVDNMDSARRIKIIRIEPELVNTSPDVPANSQPELPGSVGAPAESAILTAEAGALAQASGLDLNLVNRALVNFMASGTSSAERVRSLFLHEHGHYDVTLLRLLAAVVSDALPDAQPSVCMHAHSVNVPTIDDNVIMHPADGGPNFAFSVIDDLNLVESARFYETGMMIQPDAFRVIRRYPHAVKFYVIVDGIYRGVRLCSSAVIESLGFYPEEPSTDIPYPPCRGFYTPAEAFHYLYLAMHDRGLLRPDLRFVSEDEPSQVPANVSDLVVIEDSVYANHIDEKEVESQV